MSATLRPKTLGLLGVGKEHYEFKEWQRIFPAHRHPIYSIPARYQDKDVRIDRRTTEEQMHAWVEHIDKIIEGRLDRKGIIQTVSYDRQKYLFEHSRHSQHFIGNTNDPDSETASQIADAFRRSRAPQVLVSPSFATGWDFPGEGCEYVIVCKVPFKPNQGKVQKAREERDKQYGAYLAMIDLVQSAGRGMRSADDRCEVFVVDGHLSWFLHQNSSLAPQWFVHGVRKMAEIPKAAEKLK
jgi:Rad3-related DNA helicase